MTSLPLPVVFSGDCLEVMKLIPDASVDSIVTDPPYGLAEHKRSDVEAALRAWLSGDRAHVPTGRGFMGKEWDRFVPPPAVWDECFRVLKPGGHLLAFSGSRTFDLMGISIRLAGLDTNVSPQIRDSIAWLYGSGFPKSLDVSKAIDKAAGAEREVASTTERARGQSTPLRSAARCGVCGNTRNGTSCLCPTDNGPATEAARQWQGWGTALKPAFEPIVVARKPLVGTVAANVLAHGTGALNIDATRIGDEVLSQHGRNDSENTSLSGRNYAEPSGRSWTGRWPTNVVLDEDQAAALDQQTGTLTSGTGVTRRKDHRTDAMSGTLGTLDREEVSYGDTGGASRFFYVAKAPKKERPVVDGVAHPTVKPLALMRWLVRLVTPPGGYVLDPFAGSGTTLEAAALEGFASIGIERDETYQALIQARIARLSAAGGQQTETPKPPKSKQQDEAPYPKANPYMEPAGHAADRHYEDEPCPDCAWEVGRYETPETEEDQPDA